MICTLSKHEAEAKGFTDSLMLDHEGNIAEATGANIFFKNKLGELPPNGQGIAALQILNLLEKFDIKSMGFGSAEYIHYFTEAKKIAFADRAKYYADMEFNNIAVDYLISKEYADKRRSELIGTYFFISGDECGMSFEASCDNTLTVIANQISATDLDPSTNCQSIITAWPK